MENYTEEQVKNLIGNAVQDITNQLILNIKQEDERAKDSALSYIITGFESDKANAKGYIYSSEFADEMTDYIKGKQYHLKENFLK